MSENKIFRLLIVVIMLFIPSIVCAGGSNDDKTIDATLTYHLDRDNYAYGHVRKISISGLSSPKKYIEELDDTEIYFYDTATFPTTFSCKDTSYDGYQIIADGSDGNEYYGYGCRKPLNDDIIDWEEIELLVGEGDGVGEYTGYENTILSGNSVEFSNVGTHYIEAKREGVTTIRSRKEGSPIPKYYKYIVTKAISKVSELDSNYYYDSVTSCALKTGGYTIGGKVDFDNLKFCGSSAQGYDYAMESVSCNEGYDPFKIAFNSNETLYKGYGCRKLKNTVEAENSIEYEKKDIFIGEKVLIKLTDYYTCEVMSGDAGTLTEACQLKAEKEGIIRIKTINKKSNMPEYYEYNVKDAYTSVSDLDQTYKYLDVSSCKISMIEGTASYSEKGIVEIDNVKFCGSIYNGVEKNYEYSCPEKSEYFNVTLKKDGSIYRSIGCRQKIEQSGTSKIDDEEVPVCEAIPDEIINYLKEALKLIRWLGLVLMIVLGTLDFVKAAAADDQDAMKKASQNFIKRLIAVIILFLLPIIIELILSILSMIGFDFAKCENYHIINF